MAPITSQVFPLCAARNLYRSAADGRVFDLVEPVHDRYVRHKGERKAIGVWKFNRQVQIIEAGTTLRIQPTPRFCCIGRTMIGSTRPIRRRKLRQWELITPTSSCQTARFPCSLRSSGWMKIAGKARTTTFKSGQLLRCGAESRCE